MNDNEAGSARSNKQTSAWNRVELPEDGQLVKKEMFEYQNEHGEFTIELFETTQRTFYAIGVPKDSERMIIFGSNVVDDPVMALNIVIEKIERENPFQNR